MKTITIDLYLLEPPCQGRFFFSILDTIYSFLFLHKNVYCGYFLHYSQYTCTNVPFLWRKRYIDFFRTNNIPFMEKKRKKISLIYHQIIPLAIPEIQIVQYSKPFNFKSCSIMFSSILWSLKTCIVLYM